MQEKARRQEEVIYRICRVCGESKPLSDFHLKKDAKLGRQTICKECDIARVKQYYLDNKDQILEHKKEYRLDHKKHKAKYMEEYYLNNRERLLECKKQYYLEHKSKKPNTIENTTKRRMAVLRQNLAVSANVPEKQRRKETASHQKRSTI